MSAKRISVSLRGKFNSEVAACALGAVVHNFKYGIKNHQVPNVECLRKNVPNIASEPRGSEAGWGFSAMPQIKTKHKHNFKQNLQSFGFSSPNFDCKKEIEIL